MSAILEWRRWLRDYNPAASNDDALAGLLDQEVLPLVGESPAEARAELAALMDDYESLRAQNPPVLAIVMDAERALLAGDPTEAARLLNLIIRPKWASLKACRKAYRAAMAETRAARSGAAK